MQDSNHYEDSANWEMEGNHTLSSQLAPIGGSGAEGTKAPKSSGQPQFSGDTCVTLNPIPVPASGFTEAPVPFDFQTAVSQPGLQFDPNAFEPSSTFGTQPALQQHQWQYGLNSQASLAFNSQEILPQYPEQLGFNSEPYSVFNTQPAFGQQYEQIGVNFPTFPVSGSQTALPQQYEQPDVNFQSPPVLGIQPAFPQQHGLSEFSLQPTIVICNQAGCFVTFSRDADRLRHEASVHGVNRRAFFCHVPGCPKSTGTSYSRADKLKEHLYKKHANLGYTKRT
ncbi:hypothetical protein HYFRA_00001258 [Hymenoscyphus fraxineus]|uniref:C2H2-type domain-containing protein n=1 Tax=Hymenoscyphus fraxineus TaxID=746836 RepID=A0A9N9PXI2_9HELO|nr:hypothetical protein HYFRA_00001258 [Hymenoscyphus fraxineus]